MRALAACNSKILKGASFAQTKAKKLPVVDPILPKEITIKNGLEDLL